MKHTLLGLVHAEYSQSHTVRILELAKKLRERADFNIIIAGSGPYMELAYKAGFETVESPALDAQSILECLNKFLTPFYHNGNIDSIFNAEVQLLKEVKPDIIIRDYFREIAGIAAKYLTATDPDIHIYDVKILQALDIPSYHHDFSPVVKFNIFQTLLDSLIKITAPTVIKTIRKIRSKPLHKKVKSLGLSVNKAVYEGVKSDLVLLPESELLYPSLNLDEDHKFIGPLLIKEEHGPPPWIDRFSKYDKRIVITAGSTGFHEKGRFFIEAFGEKSNYAVALYCDSSKLPDDIPSNFFGNGRFDIFSVLPKSDVFITHGGLGSMYAGLMHGVPVIGLYAHVEQKVNSIQLERYGAGIGIDHRDASLEVLKAAVTRILSDKSFRTKAAEIGRLINPEGAIDMAADYILEGFRRSLKPIKR